MLTNLDVSRANKSCGGTSPFPSFSLPFPHLSPVFFPPFAFSPLPSSPLPLEVAPLLRLWGLGKCSAKRYVVTFRLRILPLVATIYRSSSGNETSNWTNERNYRPSIHDIWSPPFSRHQLATVWLLVVWSLCRLVAGRFVAASVRRYSTALCSSRVNYCIISRHAD